MIADDPTPWLIAAAALAGMVALMLLLGRAARRWGFAQGGFGAGTGGPKRLMLQDSLALDPRRRLLLVRCDGRDLLLLTGGGSDQVVGWLP